MQTEQPTPSRRGLQRACAVGLFVLFYLYVWLRVDPRLIYHAQLPVFVTDRTFLNGFLERPAGLVEYAAAFVCQFFRFPTVGALILTLIAWLICAATGGFLSRVGGPRVPVLQFVPAVILLLMHNDYRCPLTIGLGILAALLAVNGLARIAPRRAVLRHIGFLIAIPLLYYALGGPAVLFAGLYGIFELVNKERRVYGLCLLLFGLLYALAMPWVGAAYLFDVRTVPAYTRLLPMNREAALSVGAVVLYTYLPLAALGLRLLPRMPSITSFPLLAGALDRIRNSAFEWAFQPLVLVILAGVAVGSFDRHEKALLKADWYAQNAMWEPLLQHVRRHHAHPVFFRSDWEKPNRAVLVMHDIIRALYHTGRLPYEMFTYPQVSKTPSLLLSSLRYYKRFPVTYVKRGEVFFELGRVNESEHMAHEALELLGDRPPILERLALVNIVKGEAGAARTFLSALEKHLFWRGRARRYLARLEADPLVSSDAELARIRGRMFADDRAGGTEGMDGPMLRLLLERNQRNKMAFEYLMAHYLLTGQHDKVAENIFRLNDFDYPAIPRHYEEALLVHIMETGSTDLNLHGRHISAATVERFRGFQETLRRCRRSLDTHWRTLLKDYGDTYWFYRTYGMTMFKVEFWPPEPTAVLGPMT